MGGTSNQAMDMHDTVPAARVRMCKDVTIMSFLKLFFDTYDTLG